MIHSAYFKDRIMGIVKRMSLFLLGCWVVANVCAQNTLEHGRFQLEASLGGMVYTTPAHRVTPWLCLNDYHRLNCALTLGARYFWHKSWGVQAQLLLNPRSGQEYLYNGKVLGYNQVEVSRGSIDGNFSAGIVYRCSIGNWDIQPSFGIGITGFSETRFSSYLKHEGTNDVDSFVLEMEKDRRNAFSVTPGIQLVYHLPKRLYLYAGASYIVTAGSSYGEYTLHNLYTLELREQQRVEDNYVDALHFSFGLGFRLF